MAAEGNIKPRISKEGKQWWDPYETSHKKQFVYRPNSAAEILLYPMSTSFIDSCSQSGPFGSTVYNKDFCWKPACKPECIRTGTASGQRRNNPHPSKSFIMWRLPRDVERSPEYGVFPWKCPPSEREISKALAAQYCSTYACDFMGLPQGCDDINKARLAPLQNRRHIPVSTNNEMRSDYRLLDSVSGCSCNTDPNMTRCGIVPTVVQRHVHTQQKGSLLTTYDRFCGKRVSNVTSVIKSLLPQELQKLHRILPEEEKEALKAVLSEEACATHGKKEVNKLPAVVRSSCSPEWMSSWPGPL